MNIAKRFQNNALSLVPKIHIQAGTVMTAWVTLVSTMGLISSGVCGKEFVGVREIQTTATSVTYEFLEIMCA
jgi:hypothetical protein